MLSISTEWETAGGKDMCNSLRKTHQKEEIKKEESFEIKLDTVDDILVFCDLLLSSGKHFKLSSGNHVITDHNMEDIFFLDFSRKIKVIFWR